MGSLNKSHQAVLNLTRELTAKPTAAGVNLDISNVSDGSKVIQSLPTDENYMLLDVNLSLLNPSIYYKKFLKSVGYDPEQTTAEIEDFKIYKYESGNCEVFPVINGGSLNPYIKYRSNRSSAGRRVGKIKLLSSILGNKNVNLMNFVLTFPKNISIKLFHDKNGKQIAHDVFTSFYKKLTTSGILKIDKASKKGLTPEHIKNFQYGCYMNLHPWKSSMPFNPHFHFHLSLINYAYEKETNSFHRIIPFLRNKKKTDSKNVVTDTQKVKHLWHKTLKEFFGNELKQTKEHVNIWFKTTPGFKTDVKYPDYNPDIYNKNSVEDYKKSLKKYNRNRNNKCKALHYLKYCTRSWLVDVGNYLEQFDNDNKVFNDVDENFESLQINFERFVNLGCIQNRTYLRGYLRNLKGIIKKTDTQTGSTLYEDLLCGNNAEKYKSTFGNEERTETRGSIKSISHFKVFISQKSGFREIATIDVIPPPPQKVVLSVDEETESNASNEKPKYQQTQIPKCKTKNTLLNSTLRNQSFKQLQKNFHYFTSLENKPNSHNNYIKFEFTGKC